MAATGTVPGLAALLGRGELLPGTALLYVDTVATAYAQANKRRAALRRAIFCSWVLFGVSCVGYTVTYADAIQPGRRLAAASLALFAGAIWFGIQVLRDKKGGGP